MRDAVRLYGRYLAISVRAQLQYRAAFVMQAIGNFVLTGIEFVAIWALFARFGSLRGWSLAEVGLMYGLVDTSFAIADAIGRGFDAFGSLVRTGDFDRLLLRPRSTVLQLMGQEVRLRTLGRLLQGLGVLIWAGRAAGVSDPARLALVAFAIAGGVCLYLGIVILQATSAFWTVEALEVWNAFSYGGLYAAEYPMSIYRRWFRLFFTAVVPLACVSYLPALAILGRDAVGSPAILGWLGPLAGVAFLAVALGAWRVGVRRYTSTGS